MQCAVDKGNCSIQQRRLVFDTSIVHCESCFTILHVVQVQSDQSRLSFAAAHTSADSRTGRGADNCCMLRRKNESPPHFIAPVHFLHIKRGIFWSLLFLSYVATFILEKTFIFLRHVQLRQKLQCLSCSMIDPQT